MASDPEHPEPPRLLGTLMLSDGTGLAYAFAVHPLHGHPQAAGAVFAFARLEGTEPLVLFLDAAADLGARLAACPERETARRLGACYLLVHVPDGDDRVGAAEAVGRLARWHRPALNGRPAFAAPTAALQQVAGQD